MRVAVWREQDAMRHRKIYFGVIARSFGDQKDRSRLIAAVSINCDFRTRLITFSSEVAAGSREENASK
jgi:hypothetical protein